MVFNPPRNTEDDPFKRPMPDVLTCSDEELAKLISEAIGKTRDSIVDVAVKLHTLEQVRTDPTIESELVFDAANRYRTAERYLQQVINHEVSLYKAQLDRAIIEEARKK